MTAQVLFYVSILVLMAGLGIEAAARVRQGLTLRRVGRWLLLIGAVASLAGAFAVIDAVHGAMMRAAGQTGGRPVNFAWYQLRREGGATARGMDSAGWSAMRLHVVLAGMTIAVAGAAVAMAIRGRADRRWAWGITCLLAVGTAAAGFVAAGWRWEQVVALVGQPRDRAHLVLAGGIVVLTAAMGCSAKLRSGRRAVVLFSLLALVVAATIYTGLLMMFDGSDGGGGVLRVRRPIVQEVGE
ncbi:MAG TPA: hypothetical protein VH475_11010 [Tepidisphaeraceae bacterium]